MLFDKHFIQGALSNVSVVRGFFPQDIRVSIDSRTIQKGDIFIALSGGQSDGHAFIGEALRKGAAGIILAQEKKDMLEGLTAEFNNNQLIIIVADTMVALIELARAWRKQFGYPVVAITGSVGKTSTKEMLSAILTRNGDNHIATVENQNTMIGVAVNIMRMRANHKAAIFEVGIGSRGEMASIVQMLRPTYAVITIIGHSHMEGLGSIIDIALEKRDIFSCFTESNIGIINGDQAMLAQVSYPHPVVKFGIKTTNQVQARKVRVSGSHISFILKIYHQKYPITLKQSHAGIVNNSLAAAAAAYLLGVPLDTIVQVIKEPFVVERRFQACRMKQLKGVLIDDCYNANPESMKAALLAFQHMETEAPKIAVLADMLELGVNSPFWHRQLGRFLRKAPSLNRVILVGDMVKWTKKTSPLGLRVDVVESWQQAVDMLEQEIDQEVAILVKGSNATGLSNLVKKLT